MSLCSCLIRDRINHICPWQNWDKFIWSSCTMPWELNSSLKGDNFLSWLKEDFLLRPSEIASKIGYAFQKDFSSYFRYEFDIRLSKHLCFLAQKGHVLESYVRKSTWCNQWQWCTESVWPSGVTTIERFFNCKQWKVSTFECHEVLRLQTVSLGW